MALEGKQLEEITEDDLAALVAARAEEGRTLEFKQQLPGNSDSERKEFLADVSSFANSAGGHLTYGVRAENGQAVEAIGVESADPDSDVLRLDNIIRTGLQPRIPSHQTRAILLANGRFVLLVRIRQSWIAPHMVTFRDQRKFYARTSAGKYPLDVGELRIAFTMNDRRAEWLRTFRVERLAKIAADETPQALNHSRRLVLHLVPFSAADPGDSCDPLTLMERPTSLDPLYGSARGRRINFDGLLTNHDNTAYLQIFKNGAIESVDTLLLSNSRQGGAADLVPSGALEKSLIGAVRRYLSIEQHLERQPPILVMVSLLDVRGMRMATSKRGAEGHPIDRDDLVIPEVVIGDYEEDVPSSLRPILDAVWNACGLPGSRSSSP